MLTESVTSPIVVRGRSPRNFQARKEIPLLGSSAGSRGQALVETGVGVIASALTVKPEVKRGGSLDMQVPRSAFTFSPPKPSAGQPSALRSKYVHKPEPPGKLQLMNHSSYPSWNQQTDSLNAIPTTTMGMSSASAFASEGDIPLATSLAPPVSLSQYAPTALATDVPRYMESGRSTKSPRQQGQSSVHGSVSTTDGSSDYRYGSYRASFSGSDAGAMAYGSEPGVSATPTSARDYYPANSNSWTSSAETSSNASSSTTRPYAFDRPGKQEAALPTGHLYAPGNKGAFEAMNNYSWNAS